MGDEVAEDKPPLETPLDPAALAAVLGDETPAERATVEDGPQARPARHGASLGVGIAMAIVAFATWWWLS